MRTWCRFLFWQWSSWLPVLEWAEDWGARDGSHGTKHCQSFLRFLFATDDNCLDPCYCPELGCVVVGLVTSPRGPSSHVTRHYTARDLGEMMAGQDYLINVLPSTMETNNILNRCVFLSGVMKTVWWCDFRENLKHCKNVGFVNIGRGNIIIEANILYALDNNFFRGAVLDVFDVEPLPEDSPLWAHPSVLSMRQKTISGESNTKLLQSRLMLLASPGLRMLLSVSKRILSKILLV